MMREVRFPDGAVVRAVSLNDRQVNENWRTYGLYLDARWRPNWPASTVRWQDFEPPADSEDAARAILDAYRRVKSGEKVEIGCAGGVGRTGTVIACVAVLSGVPAREAVAWARDNFHPFAVETRAQADWVEWFGEWTGARGGRDRGPSGF